MSLQPQNEGPAGGFGHRRYDESSTNWLAAALCIGWFTYVVVDVKKRDALAAAS